AVCPGEMTAPAAGTHRGSLSRVKSICPPALERLVVHVRLQVELRGGHVIAAAMKGASRTMTRITVDAALSNQLHGLNQPAELCDSSGKVLGRFVPAVDLAEWEPVSPEVSEEEQNRRERSKERRYTTAEVLAHLEKL